MVVVVPMAGRGSRFGNQGYATPKPLIEVAGKPMILWALETLAGVKVDKLVFVALKEHEERYQLSQMLHRYKNWQTEFVFLNEVTEGQLCTVLQAEPFFETSHNGVLVVASDSYVKSGIGGEVEALSENCAGLISVIALPGEQWSFAKADAHGKVIAVAEKKRISENCSTGIYYFSRGSELISFGNRLIREGARQKGEFYVMPVYQYMIDAGLDIRLSHATEMWDMGTPESKKVFENHVLNGNR